MALADFKRQIAISSIGDYRMINTQRDNTRMLKATFGLEAGFSL